eukprot:CAMPEP_0197671000 /NCGR_PEP_ID=MMETSP1338-20131121/75800_1 /TAXON_ID=43686 ORGANISM="Pelagodinium beii, Strain RCC1491" /NCGR_SAMPLE_ID=MMETSP1338 /ASSEMBLY_ACC=CAM_ASM_000754 /LENGTH=40 /DNA_ID= /DNA_START= /DNA_END= /DNA_ORIENTATION=
MSGTSLSFTAAMLLSMRAVVRAPTIAEATEGIDRHQASDS